MRRRDERGACGSNRNEGSEASILEPSAVHGAFGAYGVQTPLSCFDLRYSECVHGKRRRDPENACTKWFTDGLVAVGVLGDDSWGQIGAFSVNRPVVVADRADEMVVIEIGVTNEERCV